VQMRLISLRIGVNKKGIAHQRAYRLPDRWPF